MAVHLRGTVFLKYWFQVFGARIGSSVILDTIDISYPALVSIGDGAVIAEGALIQGHEVKNGMLSFLPVRIGKSCSVGPYAVLQKGSVLAEGTEVASLQKTSASKSNNSKKVIEPANETEGGLSKAMYHLMGIYIVGFISALSGAILYFLYILLAQKSPSLQHFSLFCLSGAFHWLLFTLIAYMIIISSTSASPIIFAISVSTAYFAHGLILSFLTIVVNNFLSKRTDDSRRTWLKHRINNACHLRFAKLLSGTEAFCMYLRLLDAKVGNHCSIRVINPISDPKLISLGLPDHEIFRSGKSFPVIVWHSNSLSADDDARLYARGAALRILSDDEKPILDLTLKTGKVFYARSISDFATWLVCGLAGREEHVKRIPHVRNAVWFSLRDSNSYTEMHYYSNICRLFRFKDGQEMYVKFKLRPCDENIIEDSGKVETTGILPPETGAIPRPWDESEFPYVDAGEIILDQNLTKDQSEKLEFNPFRRCHEIDVVKAISATQSASIDHGRSLINEICQHLRNGEPPPESWKNFIEQSDVKVDLSCCPIASAQRVKQETSHQEVALSRTRIKYTVFFPFFWVSSGLLAALACVLAKLVFTTRKKDGGKSLIWSKGLLIETLWTLVSDYFKEMTTGSFLFVIWMKLMGSEVELTQGLYVDSNGVLLNPEMVEIERGMPVMDEIGVDVSSDIEIDDIKCDNIEEKDVSDEEIDPEELERRMFKDRIKLKRLKEKQKLAARQAAEKQNNKQVTDQARRKKMSRAQDGILKYMLKLMEVCNARGFVYGIIPEKGKPVSGSSDNLRAWWKEKVKFDKNGPAVIAKEETILQQPGSENGSSSIETPTRSRGEKKKPSMSSDSDYDVDGTDDGIGSVSSRDQPLDVHPLVVVPQSHQSTEQGDGRHRRRKRVRSNPTEQQIQPSLMHSDEHSNTLPVINSSETLLAGCATNESLRGNDKSQSELPLQDSNLSLVPSANVVPTEDTYIGAGPSLYLMSQNSEVVPYESGLHIEIPDSILQHQFQGTNAGPQISLSHYRPPNSGLHYGPHNSVVLTELQVSEFARGSQFSNFNQPPVYHSYSSAEFEPTHEERQIRPRDSGVGSSLPGSGNDISRDNHNYGKDVFQNNHEMPFASPLAIGSPYATLGSPFDLGLDVQSHFDNTDYDLDFDKELMSFFAS
ncbi:hypothetical protein K7X08_007776 [Anisodus acutangulus]|uniref:Ethylene insensitive 3-like DNA-binding domain-containing protein n=1 Tax=Anisodus acutangulus TaxID=402998 RepID=A0A9Q1MPC3_9SOLA|nr:hypothetical protein K7X08_007776 [Anisodus acutangulus]